MLQCNADHFGNVCSQTDHETDRTGAKAHAFASGVVRFVMANRPIQNRRLAK